MIVINEKLLDEFRRKARCEFCGRKARGGLDAHHIYAKGMGGGSRLDIRRNLVGLCRECHTSHHAGNEPLRCDLMALVATRENCLQDDIKEEVWRLRRTPK